MVPAGSAVMPCPVSKASSRMRSSTALRGAHPGAEGVHPSCAAGVLQTLNTKEVVVSLPVVVYVTEYGKSRPAVEISYWYAAGLQTCLRHVSSPRQTVSWRLRLCVLNWWCGIAIVACIMVRRRRRVLVVRSMMKIW